MAHGSRRLLSARVMDRYRREKIGAIKHYLLKDNVKLKVCINKLEMPELNDNSCKKCLSTIANLVLAGIDPNKIGFKVDQSTWTTFKDYLENHLEKETFGSFRGFLKMQQNLPNNINHDMYGSRDFFTWFKDFDSQSKEKDVWTYRDIYHSLPS